MMELASFFVLILSSFVTSTPYGYGAKSGALANAQSGAVAGNFAGVGALPLIPGASYSGSFSKSSSSSYSSSSASSSSSSFSYSGSGSLNGLGTHGLPSIAGNCGSEGCKSNEVNSPKGTENNIGNGFSQSQSAASAGAVAGAVAGSTVTGNTLQLDQDGNGCTGGCKKQPSSPCTGGDCESAPQKCISGQCDSNVPASNAVKESDDIQVDIGVSKNSQESNKIPDYSEKPNSYKPPYSSTASDKETQYQPTKCSTPNCDGNQYNYDSASSGNSYASSGSVYPAPSITLTAPKETKCNSLNCAASDNSLNLAPGTTSLPSSYNVPTYGSFTENTKPQDDSSETSQCTSGKCNSNPAYNAPQTTSSNPVPTTYLTPTSTISQSSNIDNVTPCKTPECQPQVDQFKTPSSSTDYPLHDVGIPSKCVSGQCGTHPSQSHPVPSPIEAYPGPIPTYSSGSFPPYKPNPITSSSSICNSPNCNGYSNQHIPSYKPNPVTSGSSKCNSPNCNGYSNPQISSYKPSPVSASGSICNSPNCNGYSSPQIPSYKPNPVSPGSSNCNSPNCNGYSSPQTPAHKVPSYVKPQYTPSVSNPADCASGKCATGLIVSADNSAANSDSNSDKEFVFVGSFGAPAGLLKPNDYSVPSKAIAGSQPAISKPNYQTPVSAPVGNLPVQVTTIQEIAPTAFVTPQVSQTKNPSGYNPSVSTGFSGTAVAGAGAVASAGIYTGGFGGPPGVLNPFDAGKSKPIAQYGTHGVQDATNAATSSQTLVSSASIPSSYENSQSGASTGVKAVSGSGSYYGSYNQNSGKIKPITEDEASDVYDAAPVQTLGNTGSNSGYYGNSQSAAVSGAKAGSGSYYSGYNGAPYSSGIKTGGSGCNSGCGSSGHNYGGANSYGFSGSLAKAGSFDILGALGAGAGASARSFAGASSTSGGRSLGSGGSYAGSYASASAGAVAGYGKR